jgi:hypothetical protein
MHTSFNNIVMRKLLSFLSIAMLLCSCRPSVTDEGITAEKAYEAVSNYCHGSYDWSMAKDNPDIMGIEMGEETDSTYQVVFRSYTGALVYFHVNKATGTTRIVEHVPSLNIMNEAGTIDLHDYLGAESKRKK